MGMYCIWTLFMVKFMEENAHFKQFVIGNKDSVYLTVCFFHC